jgi:WD40 repeat protein
LVTKQSVAICALLISVTIMAAFSLPSLSQVTSEESSFRLGWKLPVGSITFPSLSRDASLILLPSLFDGYYLYNSNGGLIQRIADPYAMMGDFSSDGTSLLLGRETGGRPTVSFIDRNTMREVWNYSLDAVHYAGLSAVGDRAVISGAVSVPTGGFQEILAVKNRNGTEALRLRLNVGTFGYASLPAISRDGKYVAIGSWGQEERNYWLYFRDLGSGASWNASIRNGVECLALSADASTIAAAGPETIYALNRQGKKLWSTSLPDVFPYFEHQPNLAVAQDGQYVAVAGGGIRKQEGYVMLFDKNGRKLWNYRTVSAVTSFAMNANATTILVGDSKGFLYVLGRTGSLLSKKSLTLSVKSVSVAEVSGVLVAVAGSFMYVMDSRTRDLWRHFEPPFSGSNLVLSADGGKIVVGDVLVLDRSGSRLSTLPMSGQPVGSEISSDGSRLVVASVVGTDSQQQSALSWFEVDSAKAVRNVTLGRGSIVRSMSMSADGGLVVVAGNVMDNFTFLYVFDSQGRKLWQRLDLVRSTTNAVAMFEDSVAVSEDGGYVVVGRRELSFDLSGHSRPPSAGRNNAVLLLDRNGQVLWNYTVDNWVTNVAISRRGETIGAAGASGIYEFDNAGKLLWTQRIEGGAIALSRDGSRFVAGQSDGRVFLGNASGPYWQRGLSGHVESVAVSGDGDVSAAIVATGVVQHGSPVKLLYILNSDGRVLGNFTFPGALTSNDRLAVARDGHCVIASLEAEGVYYYDAASEGKGTTTVQTSTSAVAPTWPSEFVAIGAVLAVTGTVIVAFAVLIRIRKRHSLND